MPPPKVLLFDIGGVCVVSPLQAILDYELAHNIPPGYINFAISRGAHDGAWQRLERGEIPLDDDFFAGFRRQLEDEKVWKEYWGVYQAKQQKQQKQKQKRDSQKSSKDAASNAVFTELGHGAPRRSGEEQQRLKKEENKGGKEGGKGADAAPPVPSIDAKPLFWTMMRMSRAPDPWMWPALKRLRRSGKYVLAALSNTVIFPEGVRDERNAVFESGLRFEKDGGVRGMSGEEKKSGSEGGEEREGDWKDVKAAFDVFISSAHVGLRKPDPKIYELAVREVEKWARESGKLDRVEMGDVLFIDDIGSNLKAAQRLGMRTLKVNLGRNKDAVKELGNITGLSLLDEEGAEPKAKL